MNNNKQKQKIMNFLNEVNFSYKEFEFQGIKFHEDKSNYPWKTDDEGEKLFDEIFEQKNEINRQRYINLTKLQLKEDIHIRVSLSIVFNVLSTFLVVLAIICGLSNFLLIGVVLFSISVISQLISIVFRKKARNSYFFGYHSCESMANFMFDDSL